MGYFDEMDEMMSRMEKKESGLSAGAQKATEIIGVTTGAIIILGLVVFGFTLMFKAVL